MDSHGQILSSIGSFCSPINKENNLHNKYISRSFIRKSNISRFWALDNDLILENKTGGACYSALWVLSEIINFLTVNAAPKKSTATAAVSIGTLLPPGGGGGPCAYVPVEIAIKIATRTTEAILIPFFTLLLDQIQTQCKLK